MLPDTIRRILLAGLLSLITAGCNSIPDPAPLPAGKSFSGTWDTNWGQLNLQQRGSHVSGKMHVHGRYKGFRNGSVTGTADGDLLLFKWTQDENQQWGRGYLKMSPDGERLEGRWGYKKARSDGGRWWATRAH